MAKAAEKGAEPKVLTTLVNPKDWADVAAAFDRSMRVFSDAVRPVLRGLPASKLSHSNLLLLVVIAGEETVRLADLIREANLIASNAGYALKALRDAGYVEVEMDPANRRTRLVYATEEGRRIAGMIRQRCRLLSEPRELAEANRTVDHLERGLEAAASDIPVPEKHRKPRSQVPVATALPKADANVAPLVRIPAPPRINPAPAEPEKPVQAVPAAASKPAQAEEMVPSLFGPVPGRSRLPRRRPLG